jgi:hypothetical protein
MKHRLPLILVCLTLIITIAAPASGQASPNPASFVPQDAALYAEFQVSAEAELQQMVQTLSALTGSIDSSAQFALVSLDSVISIVLPGVSFTDDVEPWLGDTVGVAYFNGERAPSGPRMLLVFPAADEAALAAHRNALIADLDESAGEGDVKFYTLNFDMQMAILSDTVLIGTEAEVRAALAVHTGEPSLMENDSFARLWSQLPTDAALKFSINTGSLRDTSIPNPNIFRYVIEVILRFNPATSDTEAALTNADWYGGLGGALDLRGNQVELTAVALANADSPAPQLSSETAGAGLLDYVPDDAVLVFDSYDVSLVSIIGGLAVVGPAVNDQFNFIVQNLNAPPDPDKAPSEPPPLPPIDDLYADFQPQLTQVEMVLGMDAAGVFETLSGEYAIALLPEEGESMSEGGLSVISGAAWLQTSDTADVIDLLDAGVQFLPTGGSAVAAEREVESLSNGGEVITWQKEGIPAVLSYGTLSEEVAFIAQQEVAPMVTDMALGGDTLPQSEKFPRDIIDDFGMGNEALLYVDLQALGPLVFPNAAGAMDSLAAAFDVRDDGLFLLHMTLSFADMEAISAP